MLDLCGSYHARLAFAGDEADIMSKWEDRASTSAMPTAIKQPLPHARWLPTLEALGTFYDQSSQWQARSLPHGEFERGFVTLERPFRNLAIVFRRGSMAGATLDDNGNITSLSVV
jgi:hypothetical protein